MGLLNSSIAKKVAMALSGLFLVLFLAQHCFINFTSVVSADTFNDISHFMGTNPLVQFVLQPILVFAVCFHFIMGIILEIRNRKARQIRYGKFKGSANASWVSRNMIISGLVVLAFMGLHFYDFFFPELAAKYIDGNMTGLLDPNDPASGFKYYPEVVHKFADPVRVGLYALSFVLLAMHLWHGFSSSFQSVGFNNKYSRGLKGFTRLFSVVVPALFVFIAVYHYFNQLPH